MPDQSPTQQLHGLPSLPRRGLTWSLCLKPIPTPEPGTQLCILCTSGLWAGRDGRHVPPLLVKQRNVLTNQPQFYKEKKGGFQFPSYLEHYSELHILPSGDGMPWGVAVSQGWCASSTFLFPSLPFQEGSSETELCGSDWAGPDTTEHSWIYSLSKAAPSSDTRWLHPSYGCSWLRILAGASHRCLSLSSVSVLLI